MPSRPSAPPKGLLGRADAPRTVGQSGREAPRRRSQPEIDALVTEHMPLASFAVNAVAARISLPSHVSREDLLSCAHVALVEVAKRFDPTAGASFATYALARLQGAVPRRAALRRLGQPLGAGGRPPHRRRGRRAHDLARPPADAEELAASLGVDRQRPGQPPGRRPPRRHGQHRRRDRRRRHLLDLPDTGESPSAPSCAASAPAICTTRSAHCPTASTRWWSAISSVTNH